MVKTCHHKGEYTRPQRFWHPNWNQCFYTDLLTIDESLSVSNSVIENLMGRPNDPKTTHGPTAPLRIALYSHDTCGLGHMRRNLLIADTLVRNLDDVDILLLTGAREVAAFRYPAGVDAVTLPSLYKVENESYRPRSLSWDTSELISMRSRLIKTSLEMFKTRYFHRRQGPKRHDG